jgi:hypothetical protein
MVEMKLKEASQYINRTTHALRTAIIKGNLKARKSNGFKHGHWIVTKEALHAYIDNLWDRTKVLYNGSRLYDKEKGWLSVNDAQDLMKISLQNVYYALRSNKLKGEKKGVRWVINVKDAIEYKHVDKRKRIQVKPLPAQ